MKIEDRLGLSILSIFCLGLIIFFGLKTIFHKEPVEPNYGLKTQEAVAVLRHPVAGVRVAFRFDKTTGCKCKSFIRGPLFLKKKRLTNFVLLIYEDVDHLDMHWRKRNNLFAYRYELQSASGFTNYMFAFNRESGEQKRLREADRYLAFAQDVQSSLEGETSAPYEQG